MTRLPLDGTAKVSVIVPTRNRCRLLRRALDSVRAQTYRNFELIVVDDGSTDGTSEMVRSIGDPRIRLVRNSSRRGAGYSRHLGAGLATGDFLAFLDSDDFWLRDKLARQVAAAMEHGGDRVVVLCRPSFVAGGELFDYPQPPLRPGDGIAEFIYARAGVLQTSTFLISGDLGREVRFDPELQVNQDTDYLLRLERAGAEFLYLDMALSRIDTDLRHDRISLNAALIEESLRWFERVGGDWSPQARRGYFRSDQAVRCIGAGQRLRAIQAFAKGFDPSAGSYNLLRTLLFILCGGRMPVTLRRLRRLLAAPWAAPRIPACESRRP